MRVGAGAAGSRIADKRHETNSGERRRWRANAVGEADPVRKNSDKTYKIELEGRQTLLF